MDIANCHWTRNGRDWVAAAQDRGFDKILNWDLPPPFPYFRPSGESFVTRDCGWLANPKHHTAESLPRRGTSEETWETRWLLLVTTRKIGKASHLDRPEVLEESKSTGYQLEVIQIVRA